MVVAPLAAHGLLFRPAVMIQGVVAHIAAEAMMSAPQVCLASVVHLFP